MKTAEEVLNANETDPGPLHWITKKAAVIAMKEYAKQWVDKIVNELADGHTTHNNLIHLYHKEIDAQ